MLSDHNARELENNNKNISRKQKQKSIPLEIFFKFVNNSWTK